MFSRHITEAFEVFIPTSVVIYRAIKSPLKYLVNKQKESD